MAAGLGRLPGFPRWTGMRGTLLPDHRDGCQLVVTVSFRLTRRALLWACWRMLTGRWNPDASARN